jgi:hypothetical protein
MRHNGGGQIDQGVEVLLLTRARHRQKAFDRAFAVLTPGAEADFPPLDGRSECSFGGGMPRAGLCRVDANRTPLFGADLGFGLFRVSA